ncbi:DNA damage-binding protein 2 isoform X6 [Vulpes vulpes]|uniref:DNA damage-binding protein 2 n=1 Tax=Vulpes vulpes TaxID=9627 RepID=A0ABM5AJR4_VULVU
MTHSKPGASTPDLGARGLPVSGLSRTDGAHPPGPLAGPELHNSEPVEPTRSGRARPGHGGSRTFLAKLVELGLGGGGAGRSPPRGGGAPCLGQPGRELQKIGAGGSITGLKFNPLDTNQFFTSSMEGTTRLQDFKGNTLRVFTSSGTCNFWFCSLDVSARSRMVVTGDNVGHVILLNMDGRELWNLRMHKKKVTHVALNPCCDWFLATASVDQTVKIWDLRQVRGKSSFLHSLPHSHPVNAACFSPDGAQLLTTDQKSELRVYSASQWDYPPSLIPHPHRHFQHLTPIKATWHPRYNLIVVGRYPDPNFKSCTPHELRTIDVFDGSSGKMMYQLYDPESSGIISLNEFNPMGDTLASVMGYHILIWSQEEARMRP